ncbi:MAG: DinB family protein [Bacteroidia bacterium]
MKEHTQLLFQYEKWATARVLDAMKQLPIQDEKCLEWMAHILLAQQIWYSRLNYISGPHSGWEKKTLAECVKLFESNTNLWADYCNNLNEAELLKTITYKNTKGDTFENNVKDILTHVINHSTYHRGQIIAALKGKLPTLPSTDYIFFMRE